MTTSDLDGCWTVADFTDECHVRALCANADQMEIILDSFWNMLQRTATRTARVSFGTNSGNGSAVFHKNFLVTNVSQPLLALGKLIRGGWSVQSCGGKTVLSNGMHAIPVFYRKNSLCAYGEVRAISGDHEASENEDLLAAQFCPPEFRVRYVELNDTLKSLGSSWEQVTDTCWALKTNSTTFLDVTKGMPDKAVDHRATIVFLGGRWQLLELGEKQIPDAIVGTQVITFAYIGMQTCEQLGFSDHVDVEHGDDFWNPDEHQPSAPPRLPPEEARLADGEKTVQFEEKSDEPEVEISNDKKGDLHKSVDLATRDVPKELPASLQVGDLEVTAESPLKELRAACRLWNSGQSVARQWFTEGL